MCGCVSTRLLEPESSEGVRPHLHEREGRAARPSATLHIHVRAHLASGHMHAPPAANAQPPTHTQCVCPEREGKPPCRAKEAQCQY